MHCTKLLDFEKGMDIFMSRKLYKGKTEKLSEFEEVMKGCFGFIIGGYILFMFVAAGFYTPHGFLGSMLNVQDAYGNTLKTAGMAKAEVFLNWSYVCLALLIICAVIYLIGNFKNLNWTQIRKELSITDYCVFVYLVANIIAYVTSDYKEMALFGFSGWKMGLVAQIIFVLVYAFLSRWYQWNKAVIVTMLASAFVLFFIGVLNKFQFDPFRLYDGSIRTSFLSAIGNTNWYCGYLSIVIPLGIYFYWNAKKTVSKILSAMFLAVCSASLVTQNSDSGFLALAAIVVALFWLAFQSNDCMKKFFETMIIILASFKVVGILQFLFPERAAGLGRLFYFISKGNLTLILLVFVILLYLGFTFLVKKEKCNVENLHKVRAILYLLLAIFVVLLVIYIVLNSNNKLPAGLTSKGYFHVDDLWGTNRGFIWRLSTETFGQMPWFQKIFGAGPQHIDCVMREYITEEYIKNFYDTQGQKYGLFESSHNEFLTTLLKSGLVGMLSYLGIFVTTIKRYAKAAAAQPVLLFVCVSVAAYLAHSMVSFQQPVSTPILFIFIGMGEKAYRDYKKGIIYQ